MGNCKETLADICISNKWVLQRIHLDPPSSFSVLKKSKMIEYYVNLDMWQLISDSEPYSKICFRTVLPDR